METTLKEEREGSPVGNDEGDGMSVTRTGVWLRKEAVTEEAMGEEKNTGPGVARIGAEASG